MLETFISIVCSILDLWENQSIFDLFLLFLGVNTNLGVERHQMGGGGG